MPYTITWRDAAHVDVAYTGQTSDREVLAVVRQLQGDSRFDSLRTILHDFTGTRGCTHTTGGLEEVDSLALGARFTNANIRIAVVTDRQDVTDLVQAYLAGRINRYALALFPTVKDAHRWLAPAPPSGAARTVTHPA